jgi:hypothetical protein
MREQWRMIWCLTCMASLCWVGGHAMGQAEFEVPQYPQYVQYPQSAPPVMPAVHGAEGTLTSDQIDQLLAPVALYPDPLLSLIFPAATYPQDVVAAEQWLQDTPNPTEADIDAQSWDGSIKGLVHYPTVLKMMSDQIVWTQALGAAFLSQQQNVLESVQRLRARAQVAQNLQTTQQEQVLADEGSIRIEPVDPNMIYVPQYDPDVVYSTACPVSFGIGFPFGLWCDNDFDWGRHFIVIGGGWYYGWHHPVEWDRHPPAWDRRPAGWVAAPKPWGRAPLRPAPRLTSGAVAQLGLNRPRGAAAVNPATGTARKLPAPLPIGRQPAPTPPKNVFDPTQSRDEVQRAVQRARPTPAQPTATVHAPVTVQPKPPPRPTVITPAPRAPANVAPARVAPRSAPNNVFGGGSAGETRAQSARGNASVNHR